MKTFNDYIVDTEQLRNNAKNIKSLIGDGVKYCAVVKANGYGCGIETACKSLKGIADYFACACLKEALSIRVFDRETKILILGVVSSEDCGVVSANNISISITSLEQLSELASCVSRRINIHLQVNTGLNRFGLRTLNELKKALRIIDNNEYINLEGMYTHFATKQEDRMFLNKQYLRFLQFKKRVEGRDVLCHISNSYATLKCPAYHLDMVRSGYLTYGYQNNDIGNKPVVKIHSHIVNILNAKKGDTIGYDRTFVVEKNMAVAVVPIGYADGLNRRLSNKFHLLINGIYCSILGRICMDVCMIDVSNIKVCVGDSVVILGESGKECIKISDMAEVVDTSPYEIICNFRYKRMNYIIKP